MDKIFLKGTCREKAESYIEYIWPRKKVFWANVRNTHSKDIEQSIRYHNNN